MAYNKPFVWRQFKDSVAHFRDVLANNNLTVTGSTTTGSLVVNGTTITGAEIAKIDGLTGVIPQVQSASFTETTGAGTYTGSIVVPAGALITDIKVWSTVLWTATTSATMKVGDVTDDDGFFTGVNLKATDLLVGEELNLAQTGGKEGAYVLASSGLRTAYSATARTISGVITTVGAAGSAGRTFLSVHYVALASVAATKA